MPRILIVVMSDSGHLNPMIGIARQLEARGAQVLLASCQHDIAARVARAGLAARTSLAFAPPPPTTPERNGAAADAVPASLQFRRRLDSPSWQRLWMTRAMFDAVDEQVAKLTEIVAGWRPDIVAIDAMLYAGAIAAERARIPWASIATAFNPLTPPDWPSTWVSVFAKLEGARRALEARHGVALAVRTSDLISPWLNTVFAVEELVPRALACNDFSFYVGPSRTAGPRGDESRFDWGWLRGDLPLVYVSFGSLMSPEPETLRALASALEPEQAQLVLVVKDMRRLVEPLPANVLAVEYAPQVQVLERASVMISHGGCNGVLEGLASATPLLVVPLAYDQPMNAEFVRRAGAGQTLVPVEVTQTRARDLLLPLLRADAPERAAAARIAEACKKQDGALRTAELLLELAASRAPLKPAVGEPSR
jgi:MGT family glycosyltransferase